MPRVLLVEDNPDDRELTLEAFRQRGMERELVTVNDGAQALDYLFGRGDWANPRPRQPVVVLLDLNLPKLNGEQVLKQLRANPETATLPVVILTTSNQQEDKDLCYRLGANSYVRKPVEYEAFRKVAEELQIYWLEVNETNEMD